MLIEAGAEINARAGSMKGRTCLQAAARALHSDMVELLLRFGADPNGLPAEHSGLTALQMSLVGVIETVTTVKLDEGTGSSGLWKSKKLLCLSGFDKHKSRDFSKILENLVCARADVNAPPSSDSIISTAGLVVLTRDRSCLQFLVRSGLDLDSDSHYSSAILEAITIGDIELVSDLIKHNVNMNMPGRSLSGQSEPHIALAAAAARNDIKMTEMLFEAGATLEVFDHDEVRCTPLGFAVHHFSVDLVKLLLDKGADPNGLHTIGDYTTVPLFQILRRGVGNGEDDSRRRAILKALLDAKADPNFRQPTFGTTVLQVAASWNRPESAEKLIEAGADVNASAGYKLGRTALQRAAEYANTKMYTLLRAHNADVNAPPATKRGVTALQAAAIKGHFDMVLTLLQDGANVSAPPSEVGGRHALEGAAEHGRLDIVGLLLDNDDEPSTFRRRCTEAANRAAKNGRNVIAKLLRERIAQHA